MDGRHEEKGEEAAGEEPAKRGGGREERSATGAFHDDSFMIRS
jgi:hypothetical protein